MEPFVLIAVLICPVVMGTAMLLMWREMRRGHGPGRADDAAATSEDNPRRHTGTNSESDEAHARRTS
jgi:hypothetical protein